MRMNFSKPLHVSPPSRLRNLVIKTDAQTARENRLQSSTQKKMRIQLKLVTSGVTALCAATLAIAAQTSTSSSASASTSATKPAARPSSESDSMSITVPSLGGPGASRPDTKGTPMSAHPDADVAAIVRQIEAQNSAVVERISAQFADIACSRENAQKLVEALRNGTPVTLISSASGEAKTGTFTPAGSKLGYGEAYIALALAAEALRGAGVSGCATPEQWQAVLFGGPLSAASSDSTATTSVAIASSTSRFPGILALRSQGQGWGQIAQTAQVQLGPVVASARSALKLEAAEENPLSPTGRSSSEFKSKSRDQDDASSASTRRSEEAPVATPILPSTAAPGAQRDNR